MGFLRQFLWVPFVIGTLLGGLTFADIYARWTETGWAGVPADIIAAYDALRDYFTSLIVIDWLDLPAPPPWAVDFVVLSLVGWTTLIRATVRFDGSEAHRNTIFETVFDYKQFNFRGPFIRRMMASVYFVLWQISNLIVLIQPLIIVLYIFAAHLVVTLPLALFARRMLPHWVQSWRSELLFTIAAILNGAIAFGLLYWNSIAISRVVS